MALVICDSCLRCRPQHPIDRVRIISQLLQCCLDIGNDLVGLKSVVTIDRTIVIVVGIIRVVPPGWIPTAVMTTPIAPADKYNSVAVMMPPIVIMMLTITPVIVLITFSVIPSRCFSLPVQQAFFFLRVEPLFVC